MLALGFPVGLVTGDQDALPYGLIHVQVQLRVLWKPVLELQAGGGMGSQGPGGLALGKMYMCPSLCPRGLSGQM